VSTSILEANNIERIPEIKLPFAAPLSGKRADTPSLQVAYLLSEHCKGAQDAAEVRERLRRELPAHVHAAFIQEDAATLMELHKVLFMIYELKFANPLSPAVEHEHSPWLGEVRTTIEEAWLVHDLPRIQSELPSPDAAAESSSLCDWFVEQSQKETESDRKLVRFLEDESTLEQFTTFVLTDGYLNYRFYDAMVLALVHYSETVKSEIISHMWDECGEGDGAHAHTRQFGRALATLGRTLPSLPIWSDWRPYAGYNLYFLFGQSRRHYFKAIGSLSMPELFDPGRDLAIINGARRLGFNAEKDFEYYYNHIEGDEDHGPSWLNHVVKPIVEAQPEAGIELAIGGALRMYYMRLYNRYLTAKFGLL
jgi:hypothetical protein